VSIRSVIVEDDDFTRLMIANSLVSQSVEVLASCSGAVEALEQINTLKPNLIVLDLHLGIGPTGLDIATEVRRSSPKMGILFLTSYEDPRVLDPNLPELPFGSVYLNKRKVSEINVLMDAIKTAVDHKSWRSSGPGVAKSTNSISSLSNSQLETLRLMAQGMSNSEIAKRRFVTEKSVETSISRLAKSMGLKSDPSINQRVHLAKVYFRALGIDPGEPN
jgi:two-component system nitrate/nitrite response regulator NarL